MGEGGEGGFVERKREKEEGGGIDDCIGSDEGVLLGCSLITVVFGLLLCQPNVAHGRQIRSTNKRKGERNEKYQQKKSSAKKPNLRFSKNATFQPRQKKGKRACGNYRKPRALCRKLQKTDLSSS